MAQSTRRRFLQAAAAVGMTCAATGGAAPDVLVADDAPQPKSLPRVAAINSIYRLRSHAYHICGRMIHGYRRNGFHHQPPFRLVRMYNDQYPADDLSRDHARRYGFELCDKVEQAVAGGAQGNGQLDVDAILLIVEHGDYPQNEFQQILYPRFDLFEKIVGVFRTCGRAVPVFVDKHLSYDHRKAAQMVATARELKFGLMAGSSLPVTWRQPEMEPPLGTPFTEAVATIGFDRGTPEIYLFHALEVLQCMLERRAGGESGVKSVQCLKGDAVWQAGDEGRWSWKLLDAALGRSPSNNVGPVRDNVRQPIALLVEYQDGTRGAVFNLIEQVSDFSFAARSKDRPDPWSTHFFLPPPPGARFFDPLTWNIEQFFQSGTPPYPVERTLLTSTMLDLAMHSLHEGGRLVSSPALAIRYSAPEQSGFFRGPWIDQP